MWVLLLLKSIFLWKLPTFLSTPNISSLLLILTSVSSLELVTEIFACFELERLFTSFNFCFSVTYLLNSLFSSLAITLLLFFDAFRFVNYHTKKFIILFFFWFYLQLYWVCSSVFFRRFQIQKWIIEIPTSSFARWLINKLHNFCTFFL